MRNANCWESSSPMMASNLTCRTFAFQLRKIHPGFQTLLDGCSTKLSDDSKSASSFSTSPSPSKLMSLDDVEAVLDRPTEKSTVEAKRKALKMEYEYFSYMGNLVPKVITDEMYDKLMDTECGESRRTLWEAFSRREVAGDLALVMRRRMAQHRIARMTEKVKEVERDNFDGTIYNEIGKNKTGAPHNILPRINANYIKQRFHPRVMHGVQFGQNVVFDLGLPFSMDRSAERRFNTHMKNVYNRNRTMWEPFNIFICNYDPENGPLKRLVEDKSCSSYLWNVTKKCYTDIFPREKIVYLSPKAKDVLTEYSHDDIYVIGATGDRGGSLCHHKIKELGLRSARLNLDPYFMRSGKNNFDVKEIFRILIDARDTNGDWLYSLRHLSNPKISVVRWRTKYEHLREFLDEETKNQITFLSGMTEDYADHHDQIFTNERSILKPRHEDAALFREREIDSDSKLRDPIGKASTNREPPSIASDDGAISVDENWRDFEELDPSLDDWKWEEEEEEGRQRTIEKHF